MKESDIGGGGAVEIRKHCDPSHIIISHIFRGSWRQFSRIYAPESRN